MSLQTSIRNFFKKMVQTGKTQKLQKKNYAVILCWNAVSLKIEWKKQRVNFPPFEKYHFHTFSQALAEYAPNKFSKSYPILWENIAWNKKINKQTSNNRLFTFEHIFIDICFSIWTFHYFLCSRIISATLSSHLRLYSATTSTQAFEVIEQQSIGCAARLSR